MAVMQGPNASAIYLMHRFHQKVMRDTRCAIFYHAKHDQRRVKPHTDADPRPPRSGLEGSSCSRARCHRLVESADPESSRSTVGALVLEVEPDVVDDGRVVVGERGRVLDRTRADWFQVFCFSFWVGFRSRLQEPFTWAFTLSSSRPALFTTGQNSETLRFLLSTTIL
jgi:hypothetical protein